MITILGVGMLCCVVYEIYKIVTDKPESVKDSK